MFQGIDLFSDTVTQPTVAMKEAMMAAVVGDEQKGEDPTTRQLEEMAADLLGFNAALFFPSATMANEVAIRLLTEPGDELLAAEACHLFFAETGGPAVHSAVMTRPIVHSHNGLFTADDVRNTFRFEQGLHYPISRLLSIENTTNMGGGIAWPLKQQQQVLTIAKELGLKTHLDGARLFNASVKTATAPHLLTKGFDTATICLSKGLGCPMGAILAFDSSHYHKVRRLKQLMGGSMRQSGIIAAAGIYALTHNIERLQQDHDNACLLAEKLLNSGIASITVENPEPSTNMVFFRWNSAKITPSQFLANCIDNGVRFSQVGADRFRAVTHLDISRQDIERVIELIKSKGNT